MTMARNSRVLRTIPLLIAVCLLSFPAHAQYGGGTGEPNDPYLIYTAEQMNEIGLHQEDWGKHFKLMADIDLGSFTGISYNIIGSEWDSPFTGVFNGNNKKISNFSHSSLNSNCVGIFGYINDPNAEVKDLGLIDPEVNNGTGWHTGSLVGLVDSGTITNCYAKGGSVSGYDRVGGLVGWGGLDSTITNCYATTSVWGNEDIGGLTGGAGIITNCYATGNVSGYEDVGGLVGTNYQMIINCYSMSSVSGNKDVGGLVGKNYSTITSCYSMGSISGQEDVGGLVGINWMGRITNCYSSASVTGTDYVGGLVGEGFQCTITNCYSTGQVEGLSNVGGLVGYIFVDEVSASFWDTQTSRQTISAGGTGLTTPEMQLESTFTNAGWDFVGASDGPSDIWAEPEGGGYPILCRQLSPLPALPVFSGGIGTTDEPYLISTANELNSIGYNPRLMDAHFKLINDIDLTGVDFFTMGAIRYPFTGAFDGNGKKISNLGGTEGLFEYVRGEHAHIKDLGLIDPNIDSEGGNSVGSLVGALRNGTIINCYAQGGSITGRSTIGGLVGSNSSSIANCYSSASVFGNSTIGGLVGRNNSSIANCYSSASVSGAYRIGGLVGLNFEGTIINCYAKGSGSVSYMTVGGLVGQNSAGTIKNCYSVGHVQGPGEVGGLIGSESQNGTVITSFWDTQTSGQATSAGGLPNTGGIPLQTDLMQMASIFLTVGWDFVDETYNGIDDIWWILEGQDYPRLWWETE